MQIDSIIQMAKDRILKNGEHMPMIMVELDTQELHFMACPHITNSDSNLEKQQRFFTAGRMLGEKEGEGKDIAFIAFTTEAWMSTGINRDDMIMPSQDPNRKECLIVMTLEITKKEDGKYVEQGGHIFEMLRDGSGKLIDLLAIPVSEGTEIHSTLLDAFLAGFASTKATKEVKDSLLAKMMGPDATGEEIKKMSDKIYGRKMYMYEVYPASDIPKKKGKSQYRTAKTKTKKKERKNRGSSFF